jgi:hypothetical protein
MIVLILVASALNNRILQLCGPSSPAHSAVKPGWVCAAQAGPAASRRAGGRGSLGWAAQSLEGLKCLQSFVVFPLWSRSSTMTDET